MKIIEKCPPYQNRNMIQRILQSTNYNIMTYDEILLDETRKVKKIKKREYLKDGKHQIIDQSQEYIGGYTNEKENIYENTPFVIFGDHTRTVKYVDKPSFIGADGVKVLNIKSDMLKRIDIKYIYYCLLYLEIPNNGYSRHFKYIKNSLFIIPPINIQKQIVEILDEAQNLIINRKKQIKHLDDLKESIFYDMFGDPVRNNMGWSVKKLCNAAEINPKKSELSDIKDSELEISFVPMEDVLEDGTLILEKTRKISEVYRGYTYFKENDVLFAKITPCMENGKGCIAKGLLNGLAFGSTEFHVIRANSNILIPEYIFSLTKNSKFRKEAESLMTGSAGQKRVPKQFIEDYIINIPPIKLQNEFAKKVEQIELQKQLFRDSLKLLEDNYNSLMQRAFKGELF